MEKDKKDTVRRMIRSDLPWDPQKLSPGSGAAVGDRRKGSLHLVPEGRLGSESIPIRWSIFEAHISTYFTVSYFHISSFIMFHLKNKK